MHCISITAIKVVGIAAEQISANDIDLRANSFCDLIAQDFGEFAEINVVVFAVGEFREAGSIGVEPGTVDKNHCLGQCAVSLDLRIEALCSHPTPFAECASLLKTY